MKVSQLAAMSAILLSVFSGCGNGTSETQNVLSENRCSQAYIDAYNSLGKVLNTLRNRDSVPSSELKSISDSCRNFFSTRAGVNCMALDLETKDEVQITSDSFKSICAKVDEVLNR